MRKKEKHIYKEYFYGIKIAYPFRWIKCVNCKGEYKLEFGWKFLKTAVGLLNNSKLEFGFICRKCARSRRIANQIAIKYHELFSKSAIS